MNEPLSPETPLRPWWRKKRRVLPLLVLVFLPGLYVSTEGPAEYCLGRGWLRGNIVSAGWKPLEDVVPRYYRTFHGSDLPTEAGLLSRLRVGYTEWWNQLGRMHRAGVAGLPRLTLPSSSPPPRPSFAHRSPVSGSLFGGRPSEPWEVPLAEAEEHLRDWFRKRLVQIGETRENASAACHRIEMRFDRHLAERLRAVMDKFVEGDVRKANATLYGSAEHPELGEVDKLNHLREFLRDEPVSPEEKAGQAAARLREIKAAYPDPGPGLTSRQIYGRWLEKHADAEGWSLYWRSATNQWETEDSSWAWGRNGWEAAEELNALGHRPLPK